MSQITEGDWTDFGTKPIQKSTKVTISITKYYDRSARGPYNGPVSDDPPVVLEFDRAPERNFDLFKDEIEKAFNIHPDFTIVITGEAMMYTTADIPDKTDGMVFPKSVCAESEARYGSAKDPLSKPRWDLSDRD